MTRCPALVYENTEVVIMQTDEKTFADKFLYPVCNLWAESLLYFAIYQRLTGFVTSTSLSASWKAGWRKSSGFCVQIGRWKACFLMHHRHKAGGARAQRKIPVVLSFPYHRHKACIASGKQMVLRSKYPPIFWSRLYESCEIAYFRQFPWVSIKKSSCFLIENAVACFSVAHSSEKYL